MRRLFSCLALLSIITLLFACGGGGDSTPAPTDATAPIVTEFTMPATATSLTVAVTSFTATDSVGVTGFKLTSSAVAPLAADAGWTATAPVSFTFPAAGAQTVYAWAKDAAGNVSQSKSASVEITLASAAARPVQGSVNDPVTGSAVSGATVSAFLLSNIAGTSVNASAVNAIATATTDADGNYTMTGLSAGVTYYFEIGKAGYATFFYYNIIPDAVSDLNLERARVLPSHIANLTATASGTVKNASTNVGLANMTVKIRQGVNQKTGTIIATTVTGANGDYSFADLAAGTYTAEVTGNIGTNSIVTAYFTLVSFPTTTLNSNQNFPVVSSIGEGQYKIVLNWGNAPRDLDSHLTGPTADATRFHISYINDDYPLGTATYNSTGNFLIAGEGTEVFLDVDNTQHGSGVYDDNGPETITIVVPRTGTYKYFVHHFSGSANISTSGAQVQVYKGTTLLATFNPPSGAVGTDDVWAVFTMNVTASGQTITPVNKIHLGVDTYNLDALQ